MGFILTTIEDNSYGVTASDGGEGVFVCVCGWGCFVLSAYIHCQFAFAPPKLCVCACVYVGKLRLRLNLLRNNSTRLYTSTMFKIKSADQKTKTF